MVGAKKFSLRSFLLKLPFYILALTMIIPYYWMFIGAFKPVPELIKNPPTFVVQDPSFHNFYDPLAEQEPIPTDHVKGLFQRFDKASMGFWTFFFNSLFISGAITTLSLLLASLVAYVLAKLRVRGTRVVFLIILSSMMVPWQITLIPNFLTIRDLGWLNTYWGFLFPALPSAFAVFFFRQYMLSIPDELLDAARIDGAGEFRIWRQIILPLIKPAVAAIGISVFLNAWNNFVWPLIIVQDDTVATLPLALSRLNSGLTGPQNMGVLMAGALLASLPTLIVFLLFQNQFIEGLAMGAVKQ